MSLHMVSVSDSPTLILIHIFIQKKNKGGNKQGLYQF
jgi:hypothetical protein